MKLKNGIILNEKFNFEEGDLLFSNTIGASTDQEEIDVTGCYVLPGLVDVHTHGALGYTANSEEVDYDTWQSFLLRQGVTTFLPTTATGSQEKIYSSIAKLDKAVGINMEGPYLSIERKGAHEAGLLREVDLDFLEKVKDRVKIVTVAPEVGHNIDTIEKITAMGIRVAIGHSAADYETGKRAIEKGTTQITHTFNCCPPFLHRDPGLLGAAFENENVYCEVIGDGLHLHPSVVRMLYKQVGTERMVLISDAIAATGYEDGVYKLAGLTTYVQNREARLKDGTLAGSTVTLYDVLCRVTGFGIPLCDVAKMASYTPAKALGLTDVGSLAAGMDADVLVLNQDLSIRHVFYKGNQIV
ncbi:MAG: N-acetylglucosamine-6-phosphate deacetylase [Ruminococcaceae bacterium]|nr:N-acetylglucosamine-6-phosphate deacetylase [Oscillospiraceae bacterium]